MLWLNFECHKFEVAIGAVRYQRIVKNPSNKIVPVRASYYQSMVYVKGMQKSEWVGGIGCNRKEVLGNQRYRYGLIVY